MTARARVGWAAALLWLLGTAGCFDSNGPAGSADGGADASGPVDADDGWAYCDPATSRTTLESCLEHPEILEDGGIAPTVTYWLTHGVTLVETGEPVAACYCSFGCSDRCELPPIGGVKAACIGNCEFTCDEDSDCPPQMRCVIRSDGERVCASTAPLP